jgi:hypothetical protein
MSKCLIKISLKRTVNKIQGESRKCYVSKKLIVL